MMALHSIYYVSANLEHVFDPVCQPSIWAPTFDFCDLASWNLILLISIENYDFGGADFGDYDVNIFGTSKFCDAFDLKIFTMWKSIARRMWSMSGHNTFGVPLTVFVCGVVAMVWEYGYLLGTLTTPLDGHTAGLAVGYSMESETRPLVEHTAVILNAIAICHTAFEEE